MFSYEMGLEKLMPKASSFIPGKLSPNMMEHYANAFSKELPKAKFKSTLGLQIAIESMRFIPATIFASTGYWEGAAGYYAVITYALDRLSYNGIVLGN